MTLFTPSHLERLNERDWMHGFPVHLYAERPGSGTCLHRKDDIELKDEPITEANAVEETVKGDSVPSPVLEARQAEKAGTLRDALSQLADQIPQPYPTHSVATEASLQHLALLIRDFNRAMGLPEGASLRCVAADRGLEYGRMLREEIREIEEAVASGVLHDVMAELIDVIYLILNLGQECGFGALVK